MKSTQIDVPFVIQRGISETSQQHATIPISHLNKIKSGEDG